MIKTIQTDNYKIIFNEETGVEILMGINGNPDPIVLEYPSMLDIGIMGHCENACKICYQGSKAQDNMSVRDFEIIMEQSTYSTNQCALGGRGDPNKHKNFHKILQLCKQYDIVPNYTTSGKNLKHKEVELTKEYCGAVAVSDYGENFTYKAINEFIDINMKTNIHIVVTNESIDRCIDIANNIDVWEGKINKDDINGIIFLLFKPQGNAKYMIDLIPKKEKLKLFIDTVRSSKTPFKIGFDSCIVNHLKQLVSELNKYEKILLDTCEAGRMSAYISPDMKFMPCSFSDHSLYGITINKHNSIIDIWQKSKVFNECRQRLIDNPSLCPFRL